MRTLLALNMRYKVHETYTVEASSADAARDGVLACSSCGTERKNYELVLQECTDENEGTTN